jgi:hypothetical protein
MPAINGPGEFAFMEEESRMREKKNGKHILGSVLHGVLYSKAHVNGIKKNKKY